MNKRLIYAEDAIEAVAKGLKHVFVEYQDVAEKMLNNVPSAQPYTEEEIQTMQDLEQAQLDKAYQIGVEEGGSSAQPEHTVTHECDYQRTVTHEWIPVTERLPDEDNCTGSGVQYSDYVLMTVYNKDDDETIIDFGHTRDGEWYSDTTDTIVPNGWKVVAWMPLPPSYKGDEDE